MEDAALSSGPVAQIAVDLAGNLRVANGAAEALFNLRPRDLGRPFQDLEVSYRPVELRSRIEQVRKDCGRPSCTTSNGNGPAAGAQLLRRRDHPAVRGRETCSA